MQHGFGVAMRLKPVARPFQIGSQLGMIIDFAVEDQNRAAVVADHRLIAATQIDDFQTDCAERNLRRFPDALLVRTAMRQRTRDRFNSLPTRGALNVRESSYPAQTGVSNLGLELFR